MAFVKEPGQPLKWRNKDAFKSYSGPAQPGGNNDNEKSTPQRVVVDSDHENGTHKVTAHFADGHTKETNHDTGVAARAEAEKYELGGSEDWTDRKRRIHPDQQGGESSERNYLNSDPA